MSTAHPDEAGFGGFLGGKEPGPGSVTEELGLCLEGRRRVAQCIAARDGRPFAPYSTTGRPAGSTSTELRARPSSERTSPPTTILPSWALGCEPTTIRSTGPDCDSVTAAPSFFARALA